MLLANAFPASGGMVYIVFPPHLYVYTCMHPFHTIVLSQQLFDILNALQLLLLIRHHA